MKKMFAIVLALMLCVSVMSISAFAAFDNVNSLAVVGSGIPGVGEWNPADSAGDMTEVSEGIYEKTLELPAGTTMKFKVAGNDAWDDTCNFGTGTTLELGAVTDLPINTGGGDMTFSASEDIVIKITVDLTGDVATILVAKVDGSDPIDPPADPIDPPADPIDPPADPIDPPADEVSYYVAGDEVLTGAHWNPADSNCKMTKGDNGIYTFTFKNVAVGEYQLKVTDGTWNNSWGGDGPDGNYVLKVTTAGDVTVKFDSNKKTVSADVGGKPLPKPDAKPYYVAGDEALTGANWNPADPASKMTKGENGIYTLTYKNVAAGKYQLKVTDGTWNYSAGHDGENGNFAFEVKAACDVVVEFDANKGLVTLVVDGQRLVGTPTPPPETGDVSLAAVSIALLAATAGLVAVVSKKKEF